MSRLEHPVFCAGKPWMSSRSLDSAKVYDLSPRGRFRTRHPWVFFPIRCTLFFHQLLCLACGSIILRIITYVKSGTYFYVKRMGVFRWHHKWITKNAIPKTPPQFWVCMVEKVTYSRTLINEQYDSNLPSTRRPVLGGRLKLLVTLVILWHTTFPLRPAAFLATDNSAR